MFLPAALFALRTNSNRSTGFPPYRLLFGRDASTDLEMYFSKPNQPEEFRDYDDYAVKLKERIQRATRWTQENIGGAIRRQRRAYCQRKKRYEVGQKVWLFNVKERSEQSRSRWNAIVHSVLYGKGRGDGERTVITMDIFKFIHAGGGVSKVKLHADDKRMAVLLPINQTVEVWDIREVVR